MSDNKYIIDKDSLTGIADAVRDKLGTGEATTDPQTGDIVYPEDKGYYLKQGKLAGFIYPNTSAAHYSKSEIMSVSHETILELCGNINPSFIKFTVLTTGDCRYPYKAVSKTLYNGVYFYSGEIANSSTLLNNVVGATKTFAYTGQGCYITGENGSYSSGGGYNPYIYSYYSFPGVLQIEFLNENKQNIEAAIDGPIAGTSRYTMEIPDGEVPTKIPFSIDDIQNKITNYLNASGGGGLKIFKCYNNSSIRSSEGDGWKVSNYLKFNAYFDLNFSSTSPYITTQVPDLNPENIIYMRYIGSNQTSGNTRSFVFDPTLKNVEHYTSASSSNGKRLSSTTDYYFFPDGAGSWSTSNDYGIMGMWDANNKILDLGLQQVSSRSGTYVASDYTTQYYNIPEKLIIVYKT